MKRHLALRRLSSDHHQSLVHARRLVKAAGEPAQDEAAIAQTARDFLALWSEHVNTHFREEEEVLLPTFARYGDPGEPAVVRVLVEHVQIRSLVGGLAQQVEAGKPSPETMLALGTLLREHIRHEEDVLFPLIERALPEDALADIGSGLATFRG